MIYIWMKQQSKPLSSILYKDLSAVDLTQYLAKEDKSIAEHTEELFCELHILKRLGYIRNERIYNLTGYAIFYHDIGKINESFQRRIRLHLKFDPTKEVAHNILSFYFIDPNLFECVDEYYSVAHAVLNHHDYCNTFEVLQDEKAKAIINELLAPFKTFEVRFRTIKNIKKKITDHESILIKGFLHKCDYSASAGIPIENKNDFLEQKLEDLLHRWGNGARWNDLQQFCIENRNQNIIAVAQTGMGKTEAGLHWIGNHKGFFVLPIRTAINAMYDRMKKELLQNERIDERLALLHSTALDYYLQNEIDQELDVMDYYNKSRQFSMPLSITTMDQLFDFVFKYQGHELKLATVSYSKVVIDEIQMYSADLLAYLVYGLKKIHEFGGKIAILTATFPPFIKDLLDPIEFQEGLFVTDIRRHHVYVYKEKMSSSHIIRKFNENMQKGVSNKILVVCNTVKKAQQMYKELKVLGNVHLLHSRFIQKDRSQKEKEIISFGRTYNEDGSIHVSSGIWIATQIVEASLDIDFDYLFTELSDLNGLFQRLGRCNRKGVKKVDEPNCFIFTEIDEAILKRGETGFIDRTIYRLSKEAVENLSGILTEHEKADLINKTFTSLHLADSDFMREYRETYEKIDGLYEYETAKSDIDLRNISSRIIMPKSIYEENQEFITEKINVYKDRKFNKTIRMKAKEDVMQYTVSIPRNRYYRSALYDVVHLDRYTEIPIMNYPYSEEEGLIFGEK